MRITSVDDRTKAFLYLKDDLGKNIYHDKA